VLEIVLVVIVYAALFFGLQLIPSGKTAGWLVVTVFVGILLVMQILELLGVGKGDSDLALRMSFATSSILMGTVTAGFSRLVLNGRGFDRTAYWLFSAGIGALSGFVMLAVGGMGYGMYYY
jgi:hypothetical protein